MMLQIAAMESGGNANAISSTGAIGIYQFTGKTATGVGIKNRFDVDENIAGGMKLTLENKQALQAAILPVSAENLYMMHQLGPTAAQVETAMRLNSAQPLEVIVRNEQAVAQDVPDRRLAAIASGGLGQM